MKLIDSNILIHSAKPEYPDLKTLLQSNDVAVSDISRLEVLGWTGLTEDQRKFFNAVFSLVKIFDVDRAVINKAIEIRHGKKVKTGDAIIAATAVINSCELITQNVKDFKHLAEIKVTDPIGK